jgi:hypothetical protein
MHANFLTRLRPLAGLITGSLPGTLNALLGLAVDDRGTIYVMSENAVVRIVKIRGQSTFWSKVFFVRVVEASTAGDSRVGLQHAIGTKSLASEH